MRSRNLPKTPPPQSRSTVVPSSSTRYPLQAPPASCQAGDLPSTVILISPETLRPAATDPAKRANRATKLASENPPIAETPLTGRAAGGIVEPRATDGHGSAHREGEGSS